MTATNNSLIPVSHLNAYVYCPRRFYLENNMGMFEDNPHTIEGRSKHRVVDGKDVRPAKKDDAIHRRSVAFSSLQLGISGKLDLLEEKEGKPLYPVALIGPAQATTQTIHSLRGLEGMAAKHYFSRFEQYIKPERQSFFYFKDRNRRPPQDPVNALLSFGYSLLAKDCTGAAIRVGFDPFCGYYHTMKYGRPSLALDMMEMFRQPVVDSVVLSTINNGVFKEKDFYRFQNVCYLNEKGRKKYLVQYEMRKKDMVTHPKFHYRMSYERTIELQYRLLAKYLLGDIDSYEGFTIR